MPQPAARQNHTSVAYNGYLYVIGGYHATSDTLCNATASFYCSDVQKAAINADGTVGTWSATTAFTTARDGHTSVAYNGYLYVIGGSNGSNQNGVQKSAFNTPAQTGHYERTINIGVTGDLEYIVLNGIAPCGFIIRYATAGSVGTYGSLTTLTVSAIPGNTYAFSGETGKRYIRLIITLNDETCGGTSNLSAITVNYTPPPPGTPVLSVPAASSTVASTTPQFQLRSTEPENSYLRYRIYLYQSDCTTAVSGSPFDQTVSQTGWSGQDQQTGTAYTGNSFITGSTMAAFTYSGSPLTRGTTYCWKGQAINPGTGNVWGHLVARRLLQSTSFHLHRT